MCFSIPKKIKSITDNLAIVEGEVNVKLGTIKASPGDYVLVYGNMAVEKIGKKKAEAFRKMISK